MKLKSLFRHAVFPILHILLAVPVLNVQETVGKWRALHTEELHDVTSSPSIVWPVTLMRDALDT